MQLYQKKKKDAAKNLVIVQVGLQNFKFVT